MAKNSATPGDRSRSRSVTRRGWTLDVGPPETLATNATRAFFVMIGVLVVIWAIQIANVADGYGLSQSYGIKARDVGSLPDIFAAPFLHANWTHIEGNSGPLFIFGFLAAYRGIRKFLALTVIVVLTSGFAAWLFEPSHTVEIGASGVVFGYFAYIIVRGLFDRHLIDILIGAVMALCFAYQFSVLLPHQGISWQAHVGGVVGGVLGGWLLRERRAAKTAATPSAAVASRSVFAPPGTSALPTVQAGKGSKSPAIDPNNPRADLYKQLDDMGL
jgi:membrane associated rhomboid family serine protease